MVEKGCKNWKPTLPASLIQYEYASKRLSKMTKTMRGASKMQQITNSLDTLRPQVHENCPVRLLVIAY